MTRKTTVFDDLIKVLLAEAPRLQRRALADDEFPGVIAMSVARRLRCCACTLVRLHTEACNRPVDMGVWSLAVQRQMRLAKAAAADVGLECKESDGTGLQTPICLMLPSGRYNSLAGPEDGWRINGDPNA